MKKNNNQPATKQDVKNLEVYVKNTMATKKDIENLEIRVQKNVKQEVEDLAILVQNTMASKEDFQEVKDELHEFKDEFHDYQKKAFETFATKEDLREAVRGLATRDDLREMKEFLISNNDNVFTELKAIREEQFAIHGNYQRLDKEIEIIKVHVGLKPSRLRRRHF